MQNSWMIEEIDRQRQLSIEAINNGNWEVASEATQVEIRLEKTCRLRMLEELEKGDIWVAAEYCPRASFCPDECWPQ